MSFNKGTAQDSIQTPSTTQTVKQADGYIDFFNKKYFTGYHLAIDESNLSDHPYFSYLDCKKEGYFSVHFIPKEMTYNYSGQKTIIKRSILILTILKMTIKKLSL